MYIEKELQRKLTKATLNKKLFLSVKSAKQKH